MGPLEGWRAELCAQVGCARAVVWSDMPPGKTVPSRSHIGQANVSLPWPRSVRRSLGWLTDRPSRGEKRRAEIEEREKEKERGAERLNLAVVSARNGDRETGMIGPAGVWLRRLGRCASGQVRRYRGPPTAAGAAPRGRLRVR